MSFNKKITLVKNKVLYNPIFHNKYFSLHDMRKISFFVSFRKCGRTWIQNVLAHYVGKVKGLINEPLPFSLNIAEDYPRLKQFDRKITFHHDFYLAGINDKDKPNPFERSIFKSHPTIFLIRDPRDVLVSFYHHHIDRALNHEYRGKKWKIPSTMDKETFVYHENLGIKTIVEYFNDLINFKQNFSKKLKIFKYEDLSNDVKTDSFLNWNALFEHLLQQDIDDDILKWAIEANSFQKLKTRHKNFAQDRKNRHPDVKGRVRKGEIGAYLEELNKKEIDYINNYIGQNLNDFYSFYKL